MYFCLVTKLWIKRIKEKTKTNYKIYKYTAIIRFYSFIRTEKTEQQKDAQKCAEIPNLYAKRKKKLLVCLFMQRDLQFLNILV